MTEPSPTEDNRQVLDWASNRAAQAHREEDHALATLLEGLSTALTVQGPEAKP